MTELITPAWLYPGARVLVEGDRITEARIERLTATRAVTTTGATYTIHDGRQYPRPSEWARSRRIHDPADPDVLARLKIQQFADTAASAARALDRLAQLLRSPIVRHDSEEVAKARRDAWAAVHAWKEAVRALDNRGGE